MATLRGIAFASFGLSAFLLLGARAVGAQTPGPAPSTGQQEQRSERDRLIRQVDELRKAAKFDEAIPVAERALELARKVGDEKQGRVADALSLLAESNELQGGWGRALALRKEALAARERVNEKDNWRKANARLALRFTEKVALLGEADRAKVQGALRGELRAARLEEQRKYAEAEHAAQEVRETFQALVGPQTAEVARMWNRIGRVRWRRNDARGAIESIERALETRRKVLPPIHPDIADSLNDLGIVQSALRDFAAAKSSQEESLAIFRKALPPGHSSIAGTLTSLGIVQAKLRAFAAAKANFEEVLVINRQRLAPDNPAIATSLSNLGMVQSELGEYAAAKATFEEALAVFQRARSLEHPYIDATLSNLGNVQSDLGEYKAAKASHERALAIRRKTLPPGHASIAKSLGNLGDAQRRLREFAAAKANLEEALAIFRTTLPSGHLDLATSLNKLGMVEDELLEYGAAKAHIAEALAIRRRGLPVGHPDIGDSLNSLGMVREELRDLEGAKASHEEALAIRRKTLRKDHPDIAQSLINLGKTHYKNRDFVAAKASIEEALAILFSARPLRRSEILISLDYLGAVQYELREYAGAKSSCEKALAIRRKALPPDDLGIATNLNNLGMACVELSEFAAARSCHEDALAIRRKALPPSHADIAISLSNLGNLQRGLKEFASAKLRHEEALTIRRKALPPGHADIANSLTNLGAVQTDLRDFTAAKASQEESLEIRRKALPPDDPAIATSLYNLGIAHVDLREYAAAKPLYEEALSIYRKAQPSNHTDIATTLNNLGTVQRELLEYSEAIKRYEEALTIRRKNLAPDHPDIAASLNNLATVRQEMREYAAARLILVEALAIYRKARPPDHPKIATGLGNLGMVQSELGEYAAAKANLEEALTIRRKSLPPNHPDIAATLGNLGVVQSNLLEFEAAKANFAEALAVDRKAFPRDHSKIAGSLNNLGAGQFRLAEYAAAKASFEEALSIRRKSLPGDHPDIASSLSNLAALALTSNADIADAVPRLCEAIDILQLYHLRLAAAQAEPQQLVTAAQARHSLHFLIDATVTTKPDTGLTYDRVVSVKGSVTARQRWARQARDEGDPETASVLDRLREVTLQIVGFKMAERGSNSSSDPQDVPKLLRALSDERSRLERQLTERSAIYRTIQSHARIGAKEVRAALPKGTVLIDLLEYLHVDPWVKGQEKPSVEQRMMAFVIRPDLDEVAVVPLGPSRPLAYLINHWRVCYAAGKTPPANAPDPGNQLRKRLWEPLAKHLAGVRVVLVSPDGPLNGLPWAALPGSKDGAFLVEEFAFVVVPVPQLLPELLRAKSTRSADLASLVVGNIDFEAFPGAAREGKRENNFPALPGTKAEVAAVHELFRAAFAGRPASLLAGKDATKQSFVDRAPNYSHLLVATHGFFLPEPARSQSPGPGQARSLESLLFHSELATSNPALRSGLVFAGANYEATGKGTAFLTALEASDLDLRRVDVAVLSACETGLGMIAGGEGVLGLQRAFQLAGARTMVTSLWKIPDAATQALMTRFHRNLWDKKMAKVEALRQAQLWLIKDGWKHPELDLRGGLVRPELKPREGDQVSPFYWAAFVLSGDWR
jgi:CHAT domain-containing protein/tetratricopeptide (TPR) repeat protein